MTNTTQLLDVCNGNRDAAEFLHHWRAYVHQIDDLCDGHRAIDTCPEVFALANLVYSSKFYRENAPALVVTVQLVTCAYEDSLALAHRSEPWAAPLAEVLRHAGSDMVRAVAFLTGGYAHLRRLSVSLHEACWREHHDDAGGAV